MEVIAEKELLHCELLNVLDRDGWLDRLIFQGGTVLRLCYGASHLSEDLEFSGGPGFSVESMNDLDTYLTRTLSGRGFGIEVKSPKSIFSKLISGTGVNSWRIVFEISPVRCGIPKQGAKLDIDNAPRYTEVPRAIAQNYGVVRDSRIIVRVQRREEILAGKLVAFATSVATRNRLKFS